MPNPFLFLTVGKIKKPIESFELKKKGNYKEKKINTSTETNFTFENIFYGFTDFLLSVLQSMDVGILEKFILTYGN